MTVEICTEGGIWSRDSSALGFQLLKANNQGADELPALHISNIFTYNSALASKDYQGLVWPKLVICNCPHQLITQFALSSKGILHWLQITCSPTCGASAQGNWGYSTCRSQPASGDASTHPILWVTFRVFYHPTLSWMISSKALPFFKYVARTMN